MKQKGENYGGSGCSSDLTVEIEEDENQTAPENHCVSKKWESLDQHLSWSDMIVPSTTGKDCYIIISNKSRMKSIHKWNTDQNKWEKVMNLSIEFQVFASCAAVNPNKQHIYIVDARNSQLIHVRLKDKTQSLLYKFSFRSEKLQIAFGFHTKCIYIDGMLKVFGGDGGHLEYNLNNDTYYKVNNMQNNNNIKGLGKFGMIQIKDTVLIFGGIHNSKTADSILAYNLKQRCWDTLDTTLPKPMYCIACVAVLYGRYVILFGGWTDDIYFYCLEDGIVRKSIIKYPGKALYSAFTISDADKDEKAVVGFVRYVWSEYDIDECYFPYQGLLTLMGTYYLNEFVHLFDTYTGEHWVMDSLDIVQRSLN